MSERELIGQWIHRWSSGAQRDERECARSKSPRWSGSSAQPVCFEVLEPRLLLDADLSGVAGAVEAGADAAVERLTRLQSAIEAEGLAEQAGLDEAAVNWRSPSQSVVQHIQGTFYQWYEYDMGDGQSVAALVEPEVRVLNPFETEALQYASNDWMRDPEDALGFDDEWNLDTAERVLAMPTSLDYLIDSYEQMHESGQVHAQEMGIEAVPTSLTIIEDNRERVNHKTSFPWRTIGRLNTSPGGTGTAFMISPYVALTNAHAIYDTQGYRDFFTFTPAYNGDVSPAERPYGSQTTSSASVPLQWSDREDDRQPGPDRPLEQYQYDYGWLYFDALFDGMPLTYMPLEFDYTPSAVNLAGYPGEAGGESTSDMWRGFGDATLNQHYSRILDHRISSSGGQSGSPIWTYNSDTDDRRVVAIHAFSRNSLDGFAMEGGGTRLVSQNQSLIVNAMQWVPEDQFGANETRATAANLGTITSWSEENLTISSESNGQAWFRLRTPEYASKINVEVTVPAVTAGARPDEFFMDNPFTSRATLNIRGADGSFVSGVTFGNHVDFPREVEPGQTYYISLTPDQGLWQQASLATFNLSIDVQLEEPDLVVTDSHVSPLVLGADHDPLEVMELSATVQNIGGPTSADGFYTTWYWSDEPGVSTDDHMGAWQWVEQASPGQSVHLDDWSGIASMLPTRPGTYYVAVKVDDENHVQESDTANNWSQEFELTIEGPVIDRDRSLRFADEHGNDVTVRLHGPGEAELWFDQLVQVESAGSNLMQPTIQGLGLERLAVTGSTAETTLSFQVRGGEGVTQVGDIVVDGSLNRLMMPGVALTGDVQIDGTLGRMRVGDVTGPSVIAIGGDGGGDGGGGAVGAGASLRMGAVQDLSIDSQITLGLVRASDWLVVDDANASVTAPSLGTLHVTGDPGRGLSGDFAATLNLAQQIGATRVHGHIVGVDGNESQSSEHVAAMSISTSEEDATGGDAGEDDEHASEQRDDAMFDLLAYVHGSRESRGGFGWNDNADRWLKSQDAQEEDELLVQLV